MGNLTAKTSGEIASFMSPSMTNIKSLKVHFSPKQLGTGDPSPKNIREIEGWDGVEVEKCGKNLVDTSILTLETLPAFSMSGNEGTEKAYDIHLPSGTYTFKYVDDSFITWIFINVLNKDGTWVSTGRITGNTGVYYSPVRTLKDGQFVRIYRGSGIASELQGKKIQVEIGSTATDYQPYQGTTIHTDWSNEVGTVYGGYVDLISGELVQDMAYGQVTSEWLSSRESEYIGYTSSITALGGTSGVWVRNAFTSTARERKSGGIKANCNAFKVLMNSTGVSSSQNRTAFAVDSSITNVSDFISAVETLEQNGNGLYLAYELAEPITHQLTPTQLSSFVGQNNFWSNADYVEIEYDLIETEDIQKCRKKIMLNQPHTESVINDLINFTTNMRAPLKKCKVYFNPVQEGSGDPSPDNIRNITGWDGVNIGLPNEYQEVEYIESSGTQYIDTGITLDANDFAISFNFEQTKRTSGEQPITSIWTSNYNYWNLFIRSISSDKYVLDVYTSAHHTLSTEVNLNEKYTVSLIRNENSWELTQNNSTITWTYSPSTVNNTTLKLFKRGDLSTGNATNIKMYSFTMTMLNTKVLNLIPCYRKSDGEIGMYDTVSQTFYTNSGTGTFLKGDDVNTIIGNVSWSDDVGTVYGGYADLVKGELVGNWIKRDLSEMSTINAPNSSLKEPWNHRFLIENWDYDNSGWDKIGGIDNFIIDNITNDGNGKTNFTAVGIGNSPIIYIYDNTISTVEEFKTKYSGHYICYETKYPIHYSLTPQQLLTFKGENNIWSNTNGQTEVKFWTH